MSKQILAAVVFVFLTTVCYAQDTQILDYVIGENGFEKGCSQFTFEMLAKEIDIYGPCYSSDKKIVAYFRPNNEKSAYLSSVLSDGSKKEELIKIFSNSNALCAYNTNNSFLLWQGGIKDLSMATITASQIKVDRFTMLPDVNSPAQYCTWNSKYAYLSYRAIKFIDSTETYELPEIEGEEGNYVVFDFVFPSNEETKIFVFLYSREESQCCVGVYDLTSKKIQLVLPDALKGFNEISLYKNRYFIFSKVTDKTIYYIMDMKTGESKKVLENIRGFYCNEQGDILLTTKTGLLKATISILSAESLTLKAEQFVKNGNWAEALVEYNRIIANYSASKESAGAVKQIELLSAKIENKQQADLLEEADKLLSLAKVLSESKNYEKSITTAKEVLQLMPDNKTAVLLIADCKKKITEAENQSKIGQANIFLAQAVNFFETNDLQNAKQSINKALDLMPESDEALKLLTQIEVAIAQRNSAEQEQLKLKKRQEARKKYIIALEHKKAGNLKEAFSEVNASLGIDPLYEEASKLLNEILKTGIQIVVKGTDSLTFSGSYGDSSGSSSIDGSVPARIFVNKTDVVSVSFKKQTERGTLTVEIVQDGVILNTKSTDAIYGIVTLTQKLK